MASQFPPKKNTAFTLYFSLFKNDGTIIANPGTYTKKVSIDGGAMADITASITEEDTTYGQLSIVLSSSEMNGDAIWVYIKDDTSGCVPFTCTLYTTANLMDDIKTDTAAVKVQTDKMTFTVANQIDANTLKIGGTTQTGRDIGASVLLAADQEVIAGIGAIVWNYLLTAMTTVGSIGKRIADWLSLSPSSATAYGATDLEICNNALVLLGNNPLDALTDTTKKAVRIVTQFYTQAIEETLRAYTWNCAITRDTLTADATPPEFGYSYRFAVPADCLRVLMVYDADTKFKVENGYILTDDSSGEVQYIKLIAVSEMDSLCRAALTARMASMIAFPLTNSVSVAEAMWKLYKDRLDEAQTIDAFEGTSEQMASDTWVNSRS